MISTKTTLFTFISLTTAVTFFATISVPAQATTSPTIIAGHVVPSQKLTVSDNVVTPNLNRDSYSATSVEELQIYRDAKAQEEEAARQAEETKKAEELAAQKLVEQAMANSTVGKPLINTSGVVPGQIVSAESIIAAAQQWVGVVPYGHGNHPSDSFSCDGYVQYVFAQNGISLPRGADSQAKQGTVISQSEAKAGDLLWWPGQHIAIYDGTGGYYHSPSPGKFVQHRDKIVWGNPLYIRL